MFGIRPASKKHCRQPRRSIVVLVDLLPRPHMRFSMVQPCLESPRRSRVETTLRLLMGEEQRNMRWEEMVACNWEAGETKYNARRVGPDLCWGPV